MSISAPALRIALLAAATLSAAVIVASGGCTSNAAAPIASPSPGASTTPTPAGSPTPTPSPTATPFYAISLAYNSMAPTTDPTYGPVDGYGLLGAVPQPSASITPAPSQVIHLTAGKTVTFYNFDSSPHTASFLGPVPSASPQAWPPTFTNANGASAASPEGSSISSTQFSTGNLSPGSVNNPNCVTTNPPNRCVQYNTGAPGVYYFGDYYNYLSTPHMRTVIIVQ